MRTEGMLRSHRIRKGRFSNQDGTALVELALVLPLVMLLLLGMVDFGKAFNEWIDETHLANGAARLAAVNYCPDVTNAWASGGDCGWANKGCPLIPTTQDGCVAWYVAKDADIAELKPGGSSCPSGPTLPGRCQDSYAQGQNAARVCVTYPNSSATPGDPVRVVVTVKYRYLNYLGNRAGLLSQTLSGQATMRLESAPSAAAGVSASSTPISANCYPGSQVAGT